MLSKNTIEALQVLKTLFPDISFDLCTEIEFRIESYAFKEIEVTLRVEYPGVEVMDKMRCRSTSFIKSWSFDISIVPQVACILSSFGVAAEGITSFCLNLRASGVNEITTTRFLGSCTPDIICREKMAEWFEVTGR